jgi:hypothetical protein
MFSDVTREDLAASLDRVAEEILAEAGVVGPPVDAVAVAAALGVGVAIDDRQHGRARYVRLRGVRGRPPRPTILLRPDPRYERQQWAVAHEIGEHVAHRVFLRLGVDFREVTADDREAIANAMAGRLLLPTAWFAGDAAACGWDLIALKARYPTASHELIARRMLEFSAPAIISIFDHRTLHFRRSNVAGRVPPPSSAEMRCWRAVHDRNRPQRTADGATNVQGWPVHEEGWKREILRTEVDLTGDLG